eukprot:79121-Chlamydomonas_euryale.AAC.3
MTTRAEVSHPLCTDPLGTPPHEYKHADSKQKCGGLAPSLYRPAWNPAPRIQAHRFKTKVWRSRTLAVPTRLEPRPTNTSTQIQNKSVEVSHPLCTDPLGTPPHEYKHADSKQKWPCAVPKTPPPSLPCSILLAFPPLLPAPLSAFPHALGHGQRLSCRHALKARKSVVPGIRSLDHMTSRSHLRGLSRLAERLRGLSRLAERLRGLCACRQPATPASQDHTCCSV